MATTSPVSRFAGKALGAFLDVAGQALTAKTQQAVLNKLGGSSEFVDAPGLRGVIARNPETLAKLAGASAPVVAAGTLAAGAAALGSLGTGQQNVYAQSQYSLPMQSRGTSVAFSNQQYIAGRSPMSNATVAEAMLEQQKFQHQLQLIQARQNAQQQSGTGVGHYSRGIDIMGLANQMFTPGQY